MLVLYGFIGGKMKEIINERLKLLAKAQESMMDAAIIMEQWENSQSILEKSSFDAINNSDKALNLSREGNLLINKLLNNCCLKCSEAEKENSEALVSILKEAGDLFQRIVEASKAANDTAHVLEHEVANQRVITENFKETVSTVSNNVDQAVACAEFMLAEL